MEQSTYNTQISLKHQKVDGCWQVALKVVFCGKNSEPALYHGHIEFEGIFEVHPEVPEDKTEELVRMNGGAVLYGAIRELVMNLSARSKHGPFELPTIDARMFLTASQNTTESAPVQKKQKA